MANLNLVLNLTLIGISFWMVTIVRGIGGVVGRSMNLITAGAIITGLAHLIATYQKFITPGLEDAFGAIHRGIVLIGFILLAAGFRQIKELKM